MNEISLDELISRLQDPRPGPIIEAVQQLGERLPEMDQARMRSVVEAMCGLFYIDLADRTDLQPAVEATEQALVGAGEPIVPLLLRLMEGSDFKSHFHLARVLARMGPVTLRHLRPVIATHDDPYSRAFALYAVGKIQSPAIHEALPEVVGSLMNPDREVRDSAARTVGKIVDTVPPDDLTPRRRLEIYMALRRLVNDPEPAVRAKAVRSLGKMACHRYLDPEQCGELKQFLLSKLGRGEEQEWDNAYIVRREAEEAHGHLEP